MSVSSSDVSIEDRFTVVRELGRGKFAQVREVQEKGSKKRMAWKQVQMDQDPLCAIEASLLGKLKHENIVQMYEVHSNGATMDLMLELCSKGSMSEFISSRRAMLGRSWFYDTPDPWEIGHAMVQLLGAVQFLHENRVAHRDIKPPNVLLSTRGQWKLADFNLACEFEPAQPMTVCCGTKPYLAPEVKDESYTEKCDLYSMGVVFVALAHGVHYYRPDDLEEEKPSLREETHKEAEDLMTEKRWKNSGLSRKALELAKWMLAPEGGRPDAEAALNHPWLKQHQGQAGCCTIS